MQRTTGFTLVELLVTITVIAILAAMLMVAVRLVRDQALSTKCLAHQRQIGLGMQAYANEYEDAVVPSKVFAATAGLSPALYPYDVQWQTLLEPFLNEGKADADTRFGKVQWGCPAWKGRVDGSGAVNQGWSGYGKTYVPLAPADWHLDSEPTATYEWRWAAGFRIFRFNQLPNHSGRILMGDSIDWHLFPDSGTPAAWFSWSGDPRRHRGRANYVYADLHAASRTPDQAWNGLYSIDG